MLSLFICSPGIVKDEPLFPKSIGALNAARLQRANKKNIFNLGPCCGALSAKKDLAIRRQLRKTVNVSPVDLNYNNNNKTFI